MPWVEVFTREPLAADVRVKLAQRLSDTMMGVEIGGPTENARLVDWMWFHTLPADAWAVGGSFEETYVRGRKMCFARIIAPEALLNSELKTRALAEVTKAIKDALCVAPQDDGSGIWVFCTEVPQGTWANGGTAMPMSELLDRLGGDVSQKRREEMKARFAGQAELKKEFGIPL